eukprot:m.468857 g.468857  ORF g.468857 m.468857 type:complete len:476 (-) comp27885_c0_seq1:195-1622(-)
MAQIPSLMMALAVAWLVSARTLADQNLCNVLYRRPVVVSSNLTQFVDVSTLVDGNPTNPSISQGYIHTRQVDAGSVEWVEVLLASPTQVGMIMVWMPLHNTYHGRINGAIVLGRTAAGTSVQCGPPLHTNGPGNPLMASCPPGSPPFIAIRVSTTIPGTYLMISEMAAYTSNVLLGRPVTMSSGAQTSQFLVDGVVGNPSISTGYAHTGIVSAGSSQSVTVTLATATTISTVFVWMPQHNTYDERINGARITAHTASGAFVQCGAPLQTTGNGNVIMVNCPMNSPPVVEIRVTSTVVGSYVMISELAAVPACPLSPSPTRSPTQIPTRSPTQFPTRSPTQLPTRSPIHEPTVPPLTSTTPSESTSPTLSQNTTIILSTTSTLSPTSNVQDQSQAPTALAKSTLAPAAVIVLGSTGSEAPHGATVAAIVAAICFFVLIGLFLFAMRSRHNGTHNLQVGNTTVNGTQQQPVYVNVDF